MGSKNKGGRETRKPKQDKKAKSGTPVKTVIPPSPHANDKPSK